MHFEILVLLGSLLVGRRCVLGDSCDPYSSSACEENHVCCNQQCVYATDCFGETCNDFYSNPCSGLVCCDDTCQYVCDQDYTTISIIIGVTAGVFFLIGVTSIIVCCIVRRRHRIPRGGYVVIQPQGEVHTANSAAYFNHVMTYPTGQGYGQANPQYGTV